MYGQNKARPRHPLGGSTGFHRHVTNASNGPDTIRQLTDIRNGLTMRPTYATQFGYVRNKTSDKLEKNVFEVNNAADAMYHGVSCRVRNGVLPLGQGNRSKSRIASLNATKCQRWEVESELAHCCDVLGPYACADCMRVRMRRQVYDDADRTYPGISVSERDLCTDMRMRTTMEIDHHNRLPPIKEVDTKPKRASIKGKQLPSTNPNNDMTNSRLGKPIRDSKALQQIRKRAAKNGVLPITNAELQNRVLHRQIRREATLSVGSYLGYISPRGLVEENTETSLAPTPRIRVEIQIPMVTQSREGTKTSPVAWRWASTLLGLIMYLKNN